MSALLPCRSAASLARAQAEARIKAEVEQKVHDALKQKAPAAARAKQARQAAYSTPANTTAKVGKGDDKDSTTIGSSGGRTHGKTEQLSAATAAAADAVLTTAKTVTCAKIASSPILDAAASKTSTAVLPASAVAAATPSSKDQKKAERARKKLQKKAALQLNSGVNVTTASVAQTAAHMVKAHDSPVISPTAAAAAGLEQSAAAPAADKATAAVEAAKDAVVMDDPSAAGRCTADADLGNSTAGMLADTGCTASNEVNITLTEPAAIVAQAAAAAPESILDATALTPCASVSSASAAHTSFADILPAMNSLKNVADADLVPVPAQSGTPPSGAANGSGKSSAIVGTLSHDNCPSDMEASMPANSDSSNDNGEPLCLCSFDATTVGED